MDGQKERSTRLPERVAVRVPGGTASAIERAAEAERMTVADWKRRAIRRALEHAERKGVAR